MTGWLAILLMTAHARYLFLGKKNFPVLKFMIIIIIDIIIHDNVEGDDDGDQDCHKVLKWVALLLD